MVGTTLGHYEILEPLGSGGMGDVYRARDTTLKRDVAIKVLSEAFATDTDRLARLEREAHLLASLNHPNIATIHSLDQVGDTRFLVLELVKGESLEQRLAAGPLTVEKALDIAQQIAEALEAAHGEGMIHRDLKPGNVLVTPDGRAKVLDFGIAKVVETGPQTTDTQARAARRASASPGQQARCTSHPRLRRLVVAAGLRMDLRCTFYTSHDQRENPEARHDLGAATFAQFPARPGNRYQRCP